MAKILVVDDEVGIRELLSEILRDEGHSVQLAENAAAARAARSAARPDLVLLDIWMPDTDGITLLKEWSAAGQLSMPVVMMSGHGTIDTAVEATRIGAQDFLEKPIALQKLLSSVKRALLKAATPTARPELTLAAFTRAAPLRDLKKRLDQVSAKSRALLLKSGSGSLAELCARSLQAPGKAWLDLAHHGQPLALEALEQAAGGMLFAEELSALSRLQQKNLAFALERLEKFDLHLVAASMLSVAELAAAGFDEALLRRLAEVSLGAPGLSELRDEVPEIAAQAFGAPYTLVTALTVDRTGRVWMSLSVCRAPGKLCGLFEYELRRYESDGKSTLVSSGLSLSALAPHASGGVLGLLGCSVVHVSDSGQYATLAGDRSDCVPSDGVAAADAPPAKLAIQKEAHPAHVLLKLGPKVDGGLPDDAVVDFDDHGKDTA